MSQPGRSPLYRLRAFGITNPWVVYALQRGALDEWCPRCRGEGAIITHPCGNRESPIATVRCDRTVGCPHCLRRCPSCLGSRLRAADGVRAEDFGDQESYRAACAMFPGLDVSPFKRIDMEARAL